MTSDKFTWHEGDLEVVQDDDPEFERLVAEFMALGYEELKARHAAAIALGLTKGCVVREEET